MILIFKLDTILILKTKIMKKLIFYFCLIFVISCNKETDTLNPGNNISISKTTIDEGRPKAPKRGQIACLTSDGQPGIRCGTHNGKSCESSSCYPVGVIIVNKFFPEIKNINDWLEINSDSIANNENFQEYLTTELPEFFEKE